MHFEDDPGRLEVTYSCQDGAVEGTRKGFFDVPADPADWPRCTDGNYPKHTFFSANYFVLM